MSQGQIAKRYYTLQKDVADCVNRVNLLQHQLEDSRRDAELNRAELIKHAAAHGPQIFHVEVGKVLVVTGESVTVKSLTDAMRV